MALNVMAFYEATSSRQVLGRRDLKLISMIYMDVYVLGRTLTELGDVIFF